MKNKKTNYDIWRQKLLSKPGAQEYYDSLDVEAEMLKELVEERYKHGLTQQELADLTGIDRADISKIENGNANPTIRTLRRLARALNAELVISIVPINNVTK